MKEKRRIRIGLAIVNPEAIYQSRVLDGILSQCERYDYDVLSFTPLVDVWFGNKDYLRAELNIFELMNFELIDAVIVVSISLTKDSDYSEVRRFENFLKKNTDKPVVTIDLPLGDYETVCTDDAPAFGKITAHILDVHKVDPADIYFLTGRKELDISVNRVRGYREELERRGLAFDESKVFYADFWYSGGAMLAEKLISGELAMPRAVICGNDHMAIGLANRLARAGIDVPGQVLITGYDATQDAVTNEIAITSFLPNVRGAAQEAVNAVRRRIEPGASVIPCDEPDEADLSIGFSCGCQMSIDYFRSKFGFVMYKASHDYTDGYVADSRDVSTVMESYMLEQLTSTKSPEECLEQIYLMTYLLAPYRNFYLCLRPDWLNTYSPLRQELPETMKTVIHTVNKGQIREEDTDTFCSDANGRTFSSKIMHPVLDVPRDKPGIFYFAPVHFQGDMLGYVLLHCDLSDRAKPSAVFRNWVRNVNNGLEMTRVQSRLISYSLYDSMTGLLNRRGMEHIFEMLRRNAKEGDLCFSCVIDMNWLKKINDGYGHFEGDQAIMQLARCASDMVTDKRFFAVRAGGDEFFVIGIGSFDENISDEKKYRFLQQVADYNETSDKPYRLSASVGCCLRPYTPEVKLEELIHEADARMYEFKENIKKRESFEK